MGARQYNPGYGRLVTPDENLVDQDVGDPLSWNLYGYARNNPLRYADPTGRKCVGTVDDESGNFCVDVGGTVDKVKTAGAKVALTTLTLLEPTITMPGKVAERTMEVAREWMGRPRDPGCMASLTGVERRLDSGRAGALGRWDLRADRVVWRRHLRARAVEAQWAGRWVPRRGW